MRRFVVSVLLGLVCVIAIGAIAPVAGALTRDAQMKQNVRLLKAYIDAYASVRSFAFPAAGVVRRGGITAPVWPANPWTGKPMAPGSGPGTFTYKPAASGASFTLTGHLSAGAFNVTGGTPSWLADERAAAAADLGDAHGATASAQADAAAAKRERDSAVASAASARQDRDAAVAELATAQTTLDAKKAELATTAAQLGSTQSQLATAQADAATARQERDAALANAAAARQERDVALAQLATAQTTLVAKMAELATAQAQLAASRTALAAAQADLSTTQTQLTAAKADLATAQAALSSAQADVAAARDRAAELGARVIKGYIEQWGMLSNATSPAAGDVGRTGAVGAMFSYWPDNPFTGQAMKSGAGSGDYAYSQGADATSYAMAAHLTATSVTLDSTVPQQLKNALDNARSQVANESVRVIQAAIDRYAMDNNGMFPAEASSAMLGPYIDPWPRNPWTNAPMIEGTSQGTFTYVSTLDGYTLTSHLKGGVNGDTVDNYYADHYLSVRDHLKNVYCQAAVQVIREYIEEWKAANAGTLPTAEQLTKTGAVGSAHVWWPTNPWLAGPMCNRDGKGDFQYTPGEGGSYALTVRQQPDMYYTQYYAAQ